jgi:division protein CdvB (Snf7/Vps24/ESCRT-III family)
MSKKPLVELIDELVEGLSKCVSKIDVATVKMNQQERRLFSKVVEALEKGEYDRATLYANECAEIRRIVKVFRGASETLTDITSKLKSVKGVVEFAAEGWMVSSELRCVSHELSGSFPEVAYEIGVIADKLNVKVAELKEGLGL